MQTDLLERDLCYSIVGAFFEVYNYFGCGLSESIYANALEYALIDRGHRVAREVAVDVRFKGRHVGWQRLDMIVDDRVIVEPHPRNSAHSRSNPVPSHLGKTDPEPGKKHD